MSDELVLTPEERAFADAHGFYDEEAKEWYAQIEKVYGKGNVPTNIDLSYVYDKNDKKMAQFEGPDGKEYTFVPVFDMNVCAFAEAHGFEYAEAKMWYDQMEKVYGKGKVPVNADLEYVSEVNKTDICSFEGPDGQEHTFSRALYEDIRNELAAQRKLSDAKGPRLQDGDDRFDQYIDTHLRELDDERTATTVRRNENER